VEAKQSLVQRQREEVTKEAKQAYLPVPLYLESKPLSLQLLQFPTCHELTNDLHTQTENIVRQKAFFVVLVFSEIIT
jgi:hypothetical protein